MRACVCVSVCLCVSCIRGGTRGEPSMRECVLACTSACVHTCVVDTCGSCSMALLRRWGRHPDFVAFICARAWCEFACAGVCDAQNIYIYILNKKCAAASWWWPYSLTPISMRLYVYTRVARICVCDAQNIHILNRKGAYMRGGNVRQLLDGDLGVVWRDAWFCCSKNNSKPAVNISKISMRIISL